MAEAAAFDNTEVEIRPVYEVEEWDTTSAETKAPLAQADYCQK